MRNHIPNCPFALVMYPEGCPGASEEGSALLQKLSGQEGGMSVPLPLPMPSPVVALPLSLIARRTNISCHQKCTGEGGTGWLGLCHTVSSTPSSLAEPARVQRPLSSGMSHSKSHLKFCHNLWVSSPWSH